MGDGRRGYPDDGPYNAIHVGAASPNLPQSVSFFFFYTTYEGNYFCFTLFMIIYILNKGNFLSSLIS